MNNFKNNLDLWSPLLDGRVARRVGRSVGAKVVARLGASAEHDVSSRLAASAKFINLAQQVAPIGTMFAAIEHPTESGYRRRALETSGCPVLQAKHGHLGRFMVARCVRNNQGTVDVLGTMYSDATSSCRDSLIRTQFAGSFSDIISQLRLPDVLDKPSNALPTDGSKQLATLTQIDTLSKLLANATVSTAPEVIASLEQQYQSGVARYNSTDDTAGLHVVQLQTL